eukprot:g1391.t1
MSLSSCNAATYLGSRFPESNVLLHKVPYITGSQAVFGRRSVESFRISRRLFASAETNSFNVSSEVTTVSVPTEGISADGSLSNLPDGSVPLDAFKEADKVVRDVVRADQVAADLTTNFNSAVEYAKQLSSNSADKVTKSVNEAVALFKETTDSLSNSLQSSISSISAEVERNVDEANNAVGTLISGAEESFNQFAIKLSDSIPPELRDYIDIIKAYASSAADFASVNKIPLLFGTAVALAYSSYAFLKYRYLGYSGDMLPEKVLDLLQADVPALLVDIRAEEKQQRAGVPKLRKRALGKGVPLPLCTPAVQPLRTLKSANRDLCIEITAAYIAGLKQATETTKFVIMADNDKDGRAVARTIESSDARNAFVMLGGFDAWMNSGLPVEMSKGYEINPIETISDRAQLIIEPMKNPKLLAITTAAITVTGWTLLNYHYILRFLGVLGPLIGSLVYAIKKYDTLDELLVDFERSIEAISSPSTVLKKESLSVASNENMTEVETKTETSLNKQQ